MRCELTPIACSPPTPSPTRTPSPLPPPSQLARLAAEKKEAAAKAKAKVAEEKKAAADAKKENSDKPNSKKNGRNHPPYVEMIIQALGAIKDRKGSSAPAISKYIEANWEVNEAKFKANINTALKVAVKSGKIDRNKSSYKLSAKTVKDIANKRRKKKAKATSKKKKEKKAAKAKVRERGPFSSSHLHLTSVPSPLRPSSPWPHALAPYSRPHLNRIFLFLFSHLISSGQEDAEA